MILQSNDNAADLVKIANPLRLQMANNFWLNLLHLFGAVFDSPYFI